MKFENPASGFAANNLSKNLNSNKNSIIPRIYHTICVPRYNGFVVGDVYESIL